MGADTAASQKAVEELVGHYQAKARAVGRLGVAIGASAGVLVGAVPLSPLRFAWPIPTSFGFATILGGLIVGIVESLIRDNVDQSNQSIVDLWLFVATVVLVLFWDTHRLLAIGGMTGLFALGSLFAFLKVKGELSSRPQLMAATLAELRKDAQAVKGEPIDG